MLSWHCRWQKLLLLYFLQKHDSLIYNGKLNYLCLLNYCTILTWCSKWLPNKLLFFIFSFSFQVSSVRASKSDDKRLSIFTGTKTLHLRCEAREDRSSWIDSLLSAKDLFPRILTSNDFPPAQEITISTEKLRSRLLQEGLSELAIKDCESVMLNEVSELQCQLNFLRSKHISLIERLRQLEVCHLLILFLLQSFPNRSSSLLFHIRNISCFMAYTFGVNTPQWKHKKLNWNHLNPDVYLRKKLKLFYFSQPFYYFRENMLASREILCL